MAVSKPSARLDAVTRAKTAYVMKRTTIDQDQREEKRVLLAALQSQIDLAVRFADEAGESKAAIMRALGTKDYNTVKASLVRTENVTEIVGADPLGHVYSYRSEHGKRQVTVNYVNHGPSNYNGSSGFDIKVLDDGSYMFMAFEGLWDEGYPVRNDAVAALDGVRTGFYYDELINWLGEHKA